ncbi:hypothetical protein HanXRQr2_Chr17g0797631 [Helianthus annuus]|uniref:Uncharacterized protein n=1 Tax=Helianthus annuus TaxID=4232 RepID=A0A9K3DJD2_HELAN|nr:hypothetical protein HanXRQr2_Chr17g0797631 [Helianthus annuus]KAJ0812747.1 hypothetical protein HanPSC8_Chr17g0765401 [Helianthus annuus]
MYIPKKFYTKSTCRTLLSEKLGVGRPLPPPPSILRPWLNSYATRFWILFGLYYLMIW